MLIMIRGTVRVIKYRHRWGEGRLSYQGAGWSGLRIFRRFHPEVLTYGEEEWKVSWSYAGQMSGGSIGNLTWVHDTDQAFGMVGGFQKECARIW